MKVRTGNPEPYGDSIKPVTQKEKLRLRESPSLPPPPPALVTGRGNRLQSRAAPAGPEPSVRATSAGAALLS